MNLTLNDGLLAFVCLISLSNMVFLVNLILRLKELDVVDEDASGWVPAPKMGSKRKYRAYTPSKDQLRILEGKEEQLFE